jgi:hypothetical protein
MLINEIVAGGKFHKTTARDVVDRDLICGDKRLDLGQNGAEG